MDKKKLILEVSSSIDAFEQCSDEMKDDEAVVLAAVNYCGSSLQHASERLKDNLKIVKVADDEDIDALGYASERLPPVSD